MASARSSIILGIADDVIREMPKSASAGSLLEKAELPGESSSKGLKDYKTALLSSFDRGQARAILREGKRQVWPGLNAESARLVSPDGFSKAWSRKGVNLRFTSLASDEGRNLLGFYVAKTDGLLDRPLICVNTANNPAIVGAALDHEMGHHLTAQMFQKQDGPRFLTYTGFSEHLHDPAELAADILVSVCIIPNKIARVLHRAEGTRQLRSAPTVLNAQFMSALDFIARTFRLQLDSFTSGKHGKQGLAGLIHYISLRYALLEGFDL
jgi:hypothetical protein